MTKKVLIIPLCGIGKRFKNAGYKVHKSLLEIQNFNMLERIIGKFDDNIDVYLITTSFIKKELENYLQNDKRNLLKRIFLIIVEQHTLGPAYSIFKAYSQLPKGIPSFISYCDITWDWDNSKYYIPPNTNAAIFCHYGFHPHLVNDNYSAFCLPSKDFNTLKKIKEKDSFSNDWMNEPLSIGLFYVNDLSILENPLKELINSKNKVSNEYFPSLLFNYLVIAKINVNLIPVRNFVHYGTPLQFEDFKFWINSFKNKINKSNFPYLYQSIIYTSGKGTRMKSISSVPKALIRLGEETVLETILRNMPFEDSKINIVFNDESIKSFENNNKIKYLQISETESQIESLTKSKDYLENMSNFFICSCDCFGYFDQNIFRKLIMSKKFDIICFGFNPSLLQKKTNSNYSTLENIDHKVTKILVKKILNKSNMGLAGFFWINNGEKFVNIIDQFSNQIINKGREIIIDDLVQYCIDLDYKVGLMQLDNYYHLGSPDELNEYKYWQNNYEKILRLV